MHLSRVASFVSPSKSFGGDSQHDLGFGSPFPTHGALRWWLDIEGPWPNWCEGLILESTHKDHSWVFA